MNILGIIAEYNPFHNGHKYHISRATRQIEPAGTIAVISGNFVQRGEPAFIDKHIRTETALMNGIDLVFELPSLFSSSSAEYFASGGVSLLESTGIVSHISFGCENADTDILNTVSDILLNESEEFSLKLKQYMSQGQSYPKSRIRVLEDITGKSLDFLASPNNILSVEYLKALKKLKSNIIPLPIERMGSGYNDLNLNDINPSATAIRSFIKNSSDISKLHKFIPDNGINILKQEISQGHTSDINKFSEHILTFFRTVPAGNVRNLPYVSEGLEFRLKESAMKATNLDAFFKLCNSSRYPDSRIRRIVSSVLTGITADILSESKEKNVPYLRVLGFNGTGASLLKEIKKTSALPIITKPAVLNNFTGYEKSVAQIESQATDAFNLSLNCPRPAGMDYMVTPRHDLYSL